MKGRREESEWGGRERGGRIIDIDRWEVVRDGRKDGMGRSERRSVIKMGGGSK